MKQFMNWAVILALASTPLMAQERRVDMETPALAAGTTVVAPRLSEVQQLKKDAFLLKMENATLRARLADRESRVQALETVFRLQVEGVFQKESQALSGQCKALEDDFRATLKPASDKKFDCQTLEFIK